MWLWNKVSIFWKTKGMHAFWDSLTKPVFILHIYIYKINADISIKHRYVVKIRLISRLTYDTSDIWDKTETCPFSTCTEYVKQFTSIMESPRQTKVYLVNSTSVVSDVGVSWEYKVPVRLHEFGGQKTLNIFWPLSDTENILTSICNPYRSLFSW